MKGNFDFSLYKQPRYSIAFILIFFTALFVIFKDNFSESMMNIYISGLMIYSIFEMGLSTFHRLWANKTVDIDYFRKEFETIRGGDSTNENNFEDLLESSENENGDSNINRWQAIGNSPLRSLFNTERSLSNTSVFMIWGLRILGFLGFIAFLYCNHQ